MCGIALVIHTNHCHKSYHPSRFTDLATARAQSGMPERDASAAGRPAANDGGGVTIFVYFWQNRCRGFSTVLITG